MYWAHMHSHVECVLHHVNVWESHPSIKVIWKAVRVLLIRIHVFVVVLVMVMVYLYICRKTKKYMMFGFGC